MPYSLLESRLDELVKEAKRLGLKDKEIDLYVSQTIRLQGEKARQKVVEMFSSDSDD